jgi:hypothetical protein
MDVGTIPVCQPHGAEALEAAAVYDSNLILVVGIAPCRWKCGMKGFQQPCEDELAAHWDEDFKRETWKIGMLELVVECKTPLSRSSRSCRWH